MSQTMALMLGDIFIAGWMARGAIASWLFVDGSGWWPVTRGAVLSVTFLALAALMWIDLPVTIATPIPTIPAQEAER